MRQAQRSISRVQHAKTLSVPSPVGGWNARDPLAQMDATDAVSLDNFVCTPFDVYVRPGYSAWSTGITGQVNSIFSYSPPSGALRMYSAAGANIYDTSIAGAVGTPAVSGNLSDKFQYTNFGTAGGNFLIAVNGSDLPLIYNGTAWGNAFPAAFNTAVTSITSSGTTATVTMTAAHNLKTGMSVTVAGFTPAGYNGTYAVTVTGASTFTYVLSAAQAVTTVTGTVAPGANFAITGVDPTLLINVLAFKFRLWFIERSSLRVWYLPTLSVGGAAQQFDFSSLFTRGGYLTAMGDWTLDAGYGMDDYAVFITSEGQVAVYKGTDPSSSATWSLIGVYDVGSPIGRRCFMKFGGDLTLISKDGLAPFSKALMSSRVNSQEMLTDKIQHVISDYTTTYAANFGWKVTVFPQENALLLNVPTSATTSYQLVMNTISGAWSRFIGWNTTCLELHGDFLFFGGINGVFKAWDTLSDNGTNINFEAVQSFNYFSNPSQLKQVKMLRPKVSTDGTPSILFGVNTDFDLTPPTGSPSFTPVIVAAWDSATWDGASPWGGDLQIKKDWQTAFGLGYCIAAHMKGASKNTKLRWTATDYLLEAGGVI